MARHSPGSRDPLLETVDQLCVMLLGHIAVSEGRDNLWLIHIYVVVDPVQEGLVIRFRVDVISLRVLSKYLSESHSRVLSSDYACVDD